MIRLSHLALPLLLAAAPALAADYAQAPGSTLAFATTFQGETFIGRFPRFTTRLRFDPADLPASRLEVTIPLAPVTTGERDRDETLRGSDFFDTGRHPQARYTATRFRSLGGGNYAADGVLELRGTARPVTLLFTWTPGASPVLTGRAKVKRLDFGIGAGPDWADTGVIPDEVAVSTRVLLKRVD